MKESVVICLWPLVIICLALPPITEAQSDTDPCRFFPHGTKLCHPDDCSQEIICQDFMSVNGIKCTDSKPFYNKDTHKCETQLSDSGTCGINCKTMAGKFVADKKSCYGYYYCQNEELALYNRCPSMTHFNEESQSCIGIYQSNCTVNKLNFCAIVSSGVKFKDEHHCDRYNTCALNVTTQKNELKNEQCTTKAMYFNAAKGACVAEPIDGCYPVPKDVCIVKKKIKKNYYVNDGATCRGSYYCADVGIFSDPNPQWHQCPGDKFFNQANQKCVDPKEVVCLNDRCEGSTKTFVISSQKGCRHYLRCENGVKVGDGTCGNDFFDEERGVCTPEIVTYPACYHK